MPVADCLSFALLKELSGLQTGTNIAQQHVGCGKFVDGISRAVVAQSKGQESVLFVIKAAAKAFKAS